jgi:hypothetical protein
MEFIVEFYKMKTKIFKRQRLDYIVDADPWYVVRETVWKSMSDLLTKSSVKVFVRRNVRFVVDRCIALPVCMNIRAITKKGVL